MNTRQIIDGLKEQGVNIRPISEAEYKRLLTEHRLPPKTVRIPSKSKARRDAVLLVSAVYEPGRVRDSNGEPWQVVPDTTGQATFLAVA